MSHLIPFKHKEREMIIEKTIKIEVKLHLNIAQKE